MLRIVSVNFPYIDQPRRKKIRPALCLTTPQGKYNIIVVAYITTKLDENLSTDILLDSKETAFARTGLKHTSFIRIHKLYSIGTDEITGEVGVLTTKLEREVKRKLRNLFDI